MLLAAYFRKAPDDVKQDLERVFDLFDILRERRSQPAGTFSGTLDVDAPFGVGAGLAASWTGGFYTDEANTRQPDATGRVGYVDAYVELDASARYREQTTGLGASVTLKNLLDQPFVIARRPEGIWTNGFRQIILGLSWNVPSKR